MPANVDEVQDAVDEGVRLKWLSTIVGPEGEVLTIERMELDDDGFPQPTGEIEELHADSVVLALGQEADLSLLGGTPEITVGGGVVAVGADMMTARPGVFAGGDIVEGSRTLTEAIGHGKRAARAMDAWLAGRQLDRPARHELATTEHLNTWYYADTPHAVRPHLEAARRLDLRGGGRAGWTSPPRSSRRAAACRAGIASNATTASACAPTTPS